MVAQINCLGKSAVPLGVDIAPNASLTGNTTSPGSLGLLPKTDLLASSRMINSEGSKAFLDWVLSILDYLCVRLKRVLCVSAVRHLQAVSRSSAAAASEGGKRPSQSCSKAECCVHRDRDCSSCAFASVLHR